MTPSRRGILGMFMGAALAPVATKLALASPADWTAASAGYNLSLSEIVTTTLRMRAGTIADNLTRGNALLDHLRRVKA